MTADSRQHSLVADGAADATVAHGQLRFLTPSKAAAALCLLHLPPTRHTEGGTKGLGCFGGVLVLLLLTGDHLMGMCM